MLLSTTLSPSSEDMPDFGFSPLRPQDETLRQKGPLVSLDAWRKVMGDEVPDITCMQSIIISSRSSRKVFFYCRSLLNSAQKPGPWQTWE
ncbi:unnamed protein product, partial [Symbiodinium pilosum]